MESPKPSGWKAVFKSHLKSLLPILKTVTVEPASLFMMTSQIMSYIVTQDLIIERICEANLGYEKDVCKEIVVANETFAAEDIEIQKIAAEVRSYGSIIGHSIPLIFILFIGPWSDIYGRKLPMVLSTLFIVVNSIILIVCAHYESIDGKTIGYLTTIKAFGGNEVAFAMASFSYIADITDVSSVRTIRTGLLMAGYTCGVPLGFSIGGAVRKADLSYVTSFIISGAIGLVAIVIVLFGVKNIKKSDRQGFKEDGDSPVSDKEMKWWQALDPRYSLKSVLAVTFKKRKGSERLYICLLIVVLTCVLAPVHGEFGVIYSYVRVKVKWDAGEYGDFSTYNTLIGVFGVIISMGLLSHWLQMSDPAIGFIAGISQFAGCVIYALANTPFLMYLAPTVDMVNNTMNVIARSMLSKIVPGDEIGSIFTVLAIIENLVPLAMDPLYNTLLRETIETFPGSIFMLSAALTVPPQMIYAWFVWKDKTLKAKKRSPVIEEDLESRSSKGNLDSSLSSISGSLDKNENTNDF